MLPFHDRTDAGQQLARRLGIYSKRSDVLVLALPRGGVPVAAEVARTLGVPFDLFLVRKLGVPGHEELAMGAVAEGEVTVVSRDLVRDLAIPASLVDHVTRRERLELQRRAQAFRGDRPAPDVTGKTVILVDDGLATGSTMEAAIRALRERKPARVVVAAPIGARDTVDRLRWLADAVVVVDTPERFHAVGAWYENFAQTTDEEVTALIHHSRA